MVIRYYPGLYPVDNKPITSNSCLSAQANWVLIPCEHDYSCPQAII
jgi:hypothetical protein